MPRDGGEEVFTPGGFTPYTFSQITQYSTDPSTGYPSGFVRTLPTGWTEVYGHAVFNSKNVQILLTEVIDPQGNAVNLTYDQNQATNLLQYITDAQGNPTYFYYNGANQVIQISDPYHHRNTILSYIGPYLYSITDPLNKTSLFNYPGSGALSNDWVGSMMTPLGSTTFNYSGSDTNGTHALLITDPMGLQRYALFTEPLEPPDGTYAAVVPNDIINPGDAWMDERNTFYWDKKAMAVAPNSPFSAHIYHFNHGLNGTQSILLECYKAPSISRVWYNYPGQTDGKAQINITQYLPSVIAQFVTDASGYQDSSVQLYSHNWYGKTISYTDPKGRQFNYSYDPNNGIDLWTITDRAGDTLWNAANSYNTQNEPLHEPLQVIDSAGQKWSYSYNGYGQLTAVNAPMGETTTYGYDQSSNNLITITPPQPGAGVTYTYDTQNRVASVANAANGTINYGNYDDWDRVRQITYPDGSTNTFTYDPWLLIESTDRLQRPTRYMNDLDQRPTTIISPLGMTGYSLDPVGRSRPSRTRTATRRCTAGTWWGGWCKKPCPMGPLTSTSTTTKGGGWRRPPTPWARSRTIATTPTEICWVTSTRIRKTRRPEFPTNTTTWAALRRWSTVSARPLTTTTP